MEEEDSLDFTPERMLTDALAELRANQFVDRDGEPIGQPAKAIVIMLWDEGESYGTKWYNAGMCLSEMVALLEVVKGRIVDTLVNGD